MADPELVAMEEKLQETLGTRVHIAKGDVGGQITIDFFSNEDLETILEIIKSSTTSSDKNKLDMLDKFIASQPQELVVEIPTEDLDDRTKEEIKTNEEEADLYNIKNFSI